MVNGDDRSSRHANSNVTSLTCVIKSRVFFPQERKIDADGTRETGGRPRHVLVVDPGRSVFGIGRGIRTMRKSDFPPLLARLIPSIVCLPSINPRTCCMQAEMAGKISVRQFELALRLDNPLLVARCRLYSALSLIQRGCFRTPRYTIKRIYKFAHEERDIHLQNMCQGMWAKLQYCYKQYKQRKRFASSEMLQISIRN